MVKASPSGKAKPAGRAALPADISDALDMLGQGFAIFDADLDLVACNRPFVDIRDYPKRLGRPGTALEALFRHNARRGDYGPGEADAHVRQRMERIRDSGRHQVERDLDDGRTLVVCYEPLRGGSLLVTLLDVTDVKRAEERVRELARLPQENPGPVLRIDADDRILFANEASKPLLAGLGCAAGRRPPATWRRAFAKARRAA